MTKQKSARCLRTSRTTNTVFTRWISIRLFRCRRALTWKQAVAHRRDLTHTGTSSMCIRSAGRSIRSICRIFRLQASSAFSKCGQTSDARTLHSASRRGIICGNMAQPLGTTGAVRIGVPNGTHTGMTDMNLPPCRMIVFGFRPHGRNPSPS